MKQVTKNSCISRKYKIQYFPLLGTTLAKVGVNFITLFFASNGLKGILDGKSLVSWDVFACNRNLFSRRA